MIGLNAVADVYVEGTSSGAYDVVARSGLRCRLSHPRGGQTAEDRAELAAQRVLLWEGYDLPEHAQLRVGAERWNVVAGTLATYTGPSGAEAYRRALLVRAG